MYKLSIAGIIKSKNINNMEVYSKKEEKKFTKTYDLSEYEILTDDGFVDLKYLHETIPYEVWTLKLSNGYEIECADDYIVFYDDMSEVFVKDLEIGDRVKTDDGYAIVIDVTKTDRVENMYDFQLVDNSKKRYFTNGILSHNTELAKQLAKYLFDSEDSMIRVDMSEYMDKTSVNRIIGSPPAFVGYDDSTLLDQIRRKPYCVLLMDEIEKAHPDVYNIFLQAFDDGHMTDSHGRKVSFKNCIILMTSNVGTRIVKDFGTGVGFATKHKSEDRTDEIKGILEKELKKKFAPEFINRIEEIIYFNDLGKDEIRKILFLELDKSIARLKELGFSAEIDETIIEKLIEVGYDPQYGARPMKRAIQKWVDDYLIDILLESPTIGTTFRISYDSENDVTKIEFDKVETEKKKKSTSRKKKDE
jgi:hypothetical protein